MKKNVGSQIVGAQLNSKTDGSAVTTGTTTVYVLGDGGTQAAGSVGSGACTHEGQGFWTYVPAQAETNYDHVAFTFVNTNAVAATVQIYPSFPQTGDNYARLGAPAGASVSADVAAIKAETASILTDTAEIGAAGAGLTALASQASVNTIDDFLDTEIAAIKTKTDFLPSATAGDAGGLFIAGVNAATTITTALTTTFTGNLTGSVGSVTGAVGSVTGNVGGNVTGSVGSVVGAVGSVTGAVGSVTGNVGGNVTGSVGSIALGGIAATSFAAGAIDAAAIAANAIGASELAADAVTEIQSGLATAAALTTAAGEVTAIKAKTDSLTFTVAGQVDANIQYVNDVAIQGTGAVGTDEWRAV